MKRDLRPAALMIRPLIHAISWWPLGAAVVLAVLGLLPPLLNEPSAGRALPGLRLAAAALGAAACFALPDPVAAAAVAVRRRDTVTAALAGPVTQGVALAGTLFFAGARSPWPVPEAPTWSVAQFSWLQALALTAAVLLVANREVRP